MNARNICVVGPPGSGKSTVGKKLGEILKLRVVHLDRIFFAPGWIARPAEDVVRSVEAAIIEDGWVCEGNYLRTLPVRLEKAGLLIWLDLPLRVTFPRVLRRLALGYGTVRPDVAEGCPERLNWDFLRWCLRFRQNERAKLEAAYEAFAGRKVRLQSRGDVAGFLKDAGQLGDVPRREAGSP